MDNTKIENVLKEIEAHLVESKQQVRFDVYGGGVDESFIRCTRPGLICLGTRLIRAALQEEKRSSINGGPILDDDLGDLIHPASEVKFDWIELSDDLDSEPRMTRHTRHRLRKERVIGLVFVAVVVVAFVVWTLS